MQGHEPERIDLAQAILMVAMKVAELELSRVGGAFTQESATKWYKKIAELVGFQDG